MLQNLPVQFTGGLDRSLSPLRADKGTFYNLFNFKHSRDSLGRLDQTPYFYQYTQIAQGTYYNGGSQTEPTVSSVLMINKDYVMTSYVIETLGGTQKQVFYQTVTTSGTGLNSGCFVVINNVAGLNITLGSSLDVVIDGATTFKYRKNGGAYTTLVPITTAGVSIDGGNATVYFLTATGFTVNDTWSWTRTDRASSSTATRSTADWTSYKGLYYFTSADSRIMVGYTDYCISAGYRPVWGTTLAVFDDHLVIGQYSTSSTATSTTQITVGWSDKTDLNNLIATDTNEADTFTLPCNVRDNSLNGLSIGIIGMFVHSTQLFVLTNYELYATSSLGLPIVFSFLKLQDISLVLSTTYNTYTAVVRCDSGAYVMGSRDVLFFDGSTFTSIGLPIAALLGTSFPETLMFYNRFEKELVIWSYSNRVFYVYQERWQKWYSRAGGFGDGSGTPYNVTAAFVNNGNLRLGLDSRIVLQEDTTFGNQPVKDSTAGSAYATPKITTQLLDNTIRAKKEVTSTFIGAAVNADLTPDSTYYSTSANAQVQLYWYLSDNGLISGSASTDSGALWTTASADGLISFPRANYRALALEVQLVPTNAAKPAAQVYISALEPLVKTTDARATPDR